MAGSKIRAFICVELTDGLKESIYSALPALSLPGFSRVAKENLHITLAFLGSIDGQGLDRAKDAMSSINIPQFTVSVNGFGTFNRRDPRIVYARIDKGSSELASIYGALAPKLEAVGITLEKRSYVPHITVARLHRKLNPESRSGLLSAIDSIKELGHMPMPGVSLMRSNLTSVGAVYERLFFRAAAP